MTPSTIILLALAVWLAKSRGASLQFAPPRPNQFREDAVALPLLSYLLALAVLTAALQIITDSNSPWGRLLAGSGSQLVGAAVVVAVARNHFVGGLRRFCLGDGSVTAATVVGITLVCTVFAIALCPLVINATLAIIRWNAPDYTFPPHPTLELLRSSEDNIGMTLVLWVGAVLVAPMAEELFFRGLLQTFFLNLLRSRWPAILGASAVFALIHVAQPYAMPALFVLSLLMGYAYERTGSLIPPLFIHVAFNLNTMIRES